MDDLKELLRRGVGAFEPSPDRLERMRTRLHRQRRTQRLRAGAVGLVVSLAALVFLVKTFGGPSPAQPAATSVTAVNGEIWVRVGGGDGGSFVYAVDPPTGDTRALFNDGAEPASSPGRPSRIAVGQQYAWAPDGSRLAFSDWGGTGGEGTEIYLLSPDGRMRTQLTHDDGLASFPSWSPNGREIAYASDTAPPTGADAPYYDPGCEYSMTLCPSNIAVIGTDGLSRRLITHDAAGATMPDWSPDGTKIVYVSGAEGGNIEVMNADGSDATQLTSGPAWDDLPRWSPDGTEIAFIRAATGGVDELWIMNADGSDAHQITDLGSTTVGSYAWAPDGSEIAYDTGGDQSAGSLFFLTPTGATHRVVQVVHGSGLGDLAWRPIVSDASSPPGSTAS